MTRRAVIKKFIKQFICRHRWAKDANYRQMYKDDHVVLWVCMKCRKHNQRYRWDPPVGKAA